MKGKQLVGLIAVSFGVVLLLFSFDRRWCSNKPIESETITDSPVSPTERLPNRPRMQLSGQWPPSIPLFLGGVVLIVSGVAGTIYCKGEGS